MQNPKHGSADMHAESTATDSHHPRPEVSYHVATKVTGERSHGKVTGDGERPGLKGSVDNLHSAHQQPDKNGDAPSQNENVPKSLHNNTQGTEPSTASQKSPHKTLLAASGSFRCGEGAALVNIAPLWLRAPGSFQEDDEHATTDKTQGTPDSGFESKQFYQLQDSSIGTNGTISKLSKRESLKAQKKTYRREKKKAAKELLSTLKDPSVILIADWLKVRGSLKGWTKLWCVLKPGLLVLYKSIKAKSGHWVGTVLLNTCELIERPSKKDGFCFKLFHPLDMSIWAIKGPKGETIGAITQPLPYSYLIFRAPSETADPEKSWLVIDAAETTKPTAGCKQCGKWQASLTLE